MMNKSIAFTICSNNYLAQAFSLKESLASTNPDIQFYIGLVDDPIPGMDVEGLNIHPVRKVVEESAFFQMAGIYNITELSTAVKPHYFEYFFEKYSATKVIYLDPDILVFESFRNLLDLLNGYSVVVTPHFCSPQTDNKEPSNFSILTTGVYNLGFIAFSKNKESTDFILWWKKTLFNQCYDRFGLFTDQLWVNYITCFCSKVFVLRDLGYNVANWNLHERTLSVNENGYWVNKDYPLIFFHYSNYSTKLPERMAWYNNRYQLADRPDVVPLFTYYIERLQANGLDRYSSIPPVYGKKTRKRSNNKVNKYIVRLLHKVIYKLS